jgi:hypothetical protein
MTRLRRRDVSTAARPLLGTETHAAGVGANHFAPRGKSLRPRPSRFFGFSPSLRFPKALAWHKAILVIQFGALIYIYLAPQKRLLMRVGGHSRGPSGGAEEVEVGFRAPLLRAMIRECFVMKSR